MMDDPALSQRVARLLLSGELPTIVPDRCLGGPGSGQRCGVCRAHIAASDVQVEVDDRLVLHPGCYLSWVAAVKRLAA